MDIKKNNVPPIIKTAELIEDQAEEIASHIKEQYNSLFDNFSSGILNIPDFDLFSDIKIMDGFDCSVDYRKQPAYASLTGRRGIYIFALKEEASLSYSEVLAWNGKYNGGMKGHGAMIDDSLRAAKMKNGQCFYVGSVCSLECSLQQRMKHHYSGSESAVSGLKLNLIERKCMIDKLIVMLFPIKKIYEKIGIIILPMIERELHKKLNPIAGNSR